MRFLTFIAVWCVLLVVAWPLALVFLVLMPLLWLLSIPFRIVGVILDAMVAFIRALLFLPARLLGHRG